MKLSPAVRREIEKLPKKLLGLAKDACRQTVESTNYFHFVLFLFLTAYEKYMGSKIRVKKMEIVQSSSEFRGNIKQLIFTGFESNAVSPDDKSLLR